MDDGDHTSNNDNVTAVKQHHRKKEPNSARSPSKITTTSGGGIIDITDTPDVAVWVKEMVRGRRGVEGTDNVREPSKIQSITTKSTADDKMVDPANEKEVAVADMANTDRPLTDEADISKNTDSS